MLNRIVKIEDEFYDNHELNKLTVHVDDKIVCQVKSYNTSKKISVVRSFIISFSSIINISDIETQLWLLKEFDEYKNDLDIIDEILDILTDDQALVVPDAFHDWKSGIVYNVGDRVKFNKLLYKCLQSHTSQPYWSPDVSPSLWAIIRSGEGDEILPWVQPDSTNPYMKGDKVTHVGKTWVSDIDNNVWEPGVYGWVEFLE